MKKRLALLLAVCTLAVSFMGCAKQNASSKASEAPETTPSQNEEIQSTQSSSDAAIGLIQLVEHPSLDTIRESFMEEMKNLGYSDENIHYKNAQGDMNALTTIAQGLVGDGMDAIVAITTPAAIAAAGATRDIPVIFSAATDPVAANLLTDPAKPDGNVTGVSDAIPVESIFGLAQKLTPQAKTFGFVYNLGEVNSVSVINQAKEYCNANGLSYVEATVTNSSEVQQAAQSLVGKIDAFFTPIDNTVATAMPTFTKVSLESKIPIYPGADSMVIDGGLATVGIDYTVLGAETAKMTHAVLSGTAVSELPVVTMENFRSIANQDTAEALGIDLSILDNVELFTTQS